MHRGHSLIYPDHESTTTIDVTLQLHLCVRTNRLLCGTNGLSPGRTGNPTTMLQQILDQVCQVMHTSQRLAYMSSWRCYAYAVCACVCVYGYTLLISFPMRQSVRADPTWVMSPVSEEKVAMAT